MQTLTLHGNWQLGLEDGRVLPGKLPGCNYLDLMENGLLEDPFWGRNEQEATKLSYKDYSYAKSFEVPEGLMAEESIELVAHGVDTLAVFYVNGNEAAHTDNVYRTWRIPVKDYLRVGENHIKILFKSPYPLLEKKHAERPLPAMGMGQEGVSYLRKIQCHFGWDWGPNLPPVGISGGIELQGYSKVRFEQVAVSQNHLPDGTVQLCFHAEIQEIRVIQDAQKLREPLRSADKPEDGLFVQYRIEDPDGLVSEVCVPVLNGAAKAEILIDHPQLWWCNGLGAQPLYTVTAALQQSDQKTHPATLDIWQRRIGLRTIELDTAADQWGNNFRFVVNGVPIFAKGANWIPSDSFVNRTTRQDLQFYVESAKSANMNMLRVWGGGYYETDDFYDLCDEHGILIWQDIAFACKVYPFDDPEFLENVRLEVKDNIQRLRHHAGLALWCGNNEILMMALMWRKDAAMTEMVNHFFFDTLREWAQANDGLTPYWPGSPSSGSPRVRANTFKSGDTHLWQVWHGLSAVEAFRRFPTRFCSEYGLESLPSLRVIRSFTDIEEPKLLDADMLSHQKSGGGNEKMLYYLLAKYHRPHTIRDTIYLTQLMQAEAVRSATEFWRQNMGRCNGSLYWQYNDCWPVSSWASIDYGKQYKALQYQARHFNEPICVSAQILQRKVQIFVLNDLPQAFEGKLEWRFSTLEGKELSAGATDVSVGASTAKQNTTISFAGNLKGTSKRNCSLELTLAQDGKIISRRDYLLVADKKARLRDPEIQMELSIDGASAQVTLQAKRYARSVFIEVEDTQENLSDNFFDIPAGVVKQIRLQETDSVGFESLKERVHIRSMYDVPTDGNRLRDAWTRISMRLKKSSIRAWFITRV